LKVTVIISYHIFVGFCNSSKMLRIEKRFLEVSFEINNEG